MGKLKLTKFELDVLNMLLDGSNDILEKLREQLEYSILLSREFTGVGIYLSFSIPSSINKLHESFQVKDKFKIGDLGGVIGPPAVEAGFILWINDGKLDFLEGYTYGNNKWPDHVEEYELYYYGKSERKWANLFNVWLN